MTVQFAATGCEHMFYKIHQLLRLNSIMSRFFFWVFLLIILTSCLYIVLFVVIDKQHRIHDAEANLTFGLQNQQNLVENWAEDRAEEVRLYASFSVTKETNIDVMATRFKYYHDHHQQLDSIVFIDKEGYVVIDTATEQIMVDDSDISLKDRNYFKAAEAGEPYMHDVITSRATGEQAIIFSSPVHNEAGNFAGVVFGAVRLEKIQAMLSQTVQGKTAEVIFANNEGDILSRVMGEDAPTSEAPTTMSDRELIELVKTNESDLLSYQDTDGQEVLATFTELFDGRYYLINKIDKQEILAPHSQMVMFMIITGLVIMLVGFVVVVPVSQQLIKPFVSLVQAIDHVKAGNYQTKIDEKAFTTSPIELKQFMYSFNEMTTSIQKNKQVLKRLSKTDGLTGIANRRRFEERLEREWQQALNNQTPVSLIFADVDYFKSYNDQFGHLMGDSCLIQLAHAMKSLIENPKYLVARYGGEEFVIVMPQTASKEATEVAEEVRQQVRNLQIRWSKEDAEKYITISLGVATMTPSQATTKESLIQLADQALYEAKSSGRNQVVVKK